MLLTLPTSYEQRDVLQEYLMAKAMVMGVNPYLSLDKLAEMFIGKFYFLPHPTPYPPFIAILSTPLLAFSINQVIIVWLIFELACLFGLACLLSILVDDRLKWVRVFITFFLLLAWYLVMVELYLGQLSILLIFLLTAALVVVRKKHTYLAGVIIGITIAIKIITWPLLIYFALKRDWRVVLAGSLTALGLNLVALAGMGTGPFTEYYLHVSRQLTTYYQGIIYNMSLWSIGFRFFGGSTSTPVENYFNAPALINTPWISGFISIGLVGAVLSVGLLWAVKCKDPNISFSILISMIIAIGPTSWHHYYVMIIPVLLVLWQSLVKLSFPPWKTLVFLILFLMFFIGNSKIDSVIIYLNGGLPVLERNNYQITFASSLLIYLPLIELMAINILLWLTVKTGELDQQKTDEFSMEVSTA